MIIKIITIAITQVPIYHANSEIQSPVNVGKSYTYTYVSNLNHSIHLPHLRRQAMKYASYQFIAQDALCGTSYVLIITRRCISESVVRQILWRFKCTWFIFISYCFLVTVLLPCFFRFIIFLAACMKCFDSILFYSLSSLFILSHFSQSLPSFIFYSFFNFALRLYFLFRMISCDLLSFCLFSSTWKIE